MKCSVYWHGRGCPKNSLYEALFASFIRFILFFLHLNGGGGGEKNFSHTSNKHIVLIQSKLKFLHFCVFTIASIDDVETGHHEYEMIHTRTSFLSTNRNLTASTSTEFSVGYRQ